MIGQGKKMLANPARAKAMPAANRTCHLAFIVRKKVKPLAAAKTAGNVPSPNPVINRNPCSAEPVSEEKNTAP